MKTWWFWLFLLVGLTAHGVITLVVLDSMRRERCQHQHNVYECAAIYVPVTPDGQPLDMSDPFHGEDE